MPPRRSPDDLSRERLLAAGLRLAQALGLRRLTVRAVAAEADANLGSFVYHFGTRDHFVAELIERLYAPLFARLQPEAAEAGNALSALRRALLQLVGWLVAHRDFIAHLVLDAGAGEPAARAFLQGLDQRHPALLLRLIQQAQQAGQLQRGDAMHQLLFLMSTLAAPVLLFHLAGQRGLAPPQFAAEMARFTIEPRQIEQRLDWALRGLSPEVAER